MSSFRRHNSRVCNLVSHEAKEVETGVAIYLFKGMGNAGFMLTQFQPNACKPLLYQIETVFDYASVSVKDHQIIGIHNDLRLPVELAPRFFWVPSRPGWKLSPNMRFESMQGDVGQKRRQWRRNSAHLHGSRRACFTIPRPKRSVRLSPHFAFHHCRFKSPTVGVCTPGWQSYLGVR
jgi:hypothetical protein